jgi:lysophospholipase L1-like esterase
VRFRHGELVFRALAAVFALALLEIGLRALDLPATDTCWVPAEDAWVADDALGFAYRPGARVAGGVINAIGLRGPVPAPQKSAHALRLLFVGDSSVYGWNLADADTLWWQTARRLAARLPDREVEPIVAAAPGYSSHHSRVLVDRLLAARPDWVVLYLGAYNDHRRRVYYPDADIPSRMARRRAAWHEIHALRAGEYLGDRLGKWLGRNVRDRAALVRVPPAAFEANLRAMLAAIERAGARALVLVPPFSPKLRASHAVADYEAILARVPAELGVPRIDLGPLFAGDDGFMPDGFHPNAQGQARIAEAVVAAVAPLQESAAVR